MRAEPAATVEPAVGSPVARPYFIGPRGSMFAWHHAPPADRRRGACVVLCPPLGYEYMSAYTTWRLLAERLTALGFDVLRFDYDGTGDSFGDSEPDCVDSWLQSIEIAVAEVLGRSGCSPVALVGLRAGALLALQAASARGGVERLVLWSPFRSGRAYIREVTALTSLTREDHTFDDDEEAGLSVSGYVMTKQTAETLASWTLDAIVAPPARDVLIVDHDDRPVHSHIEDHLEALGSRVTRIRPHGTAAMLVLPQRATVPVQALDEITGWLACWHVPPEPPTVPPSVGRDEGAVARHDSCRERAVQFGPAGRLFGILSAPIDAAGESPAIILLNTGVEYHIGPHRLYVPLARDWAARGHLVLRFDFGGIGDSAPAPGAEPHVAYPEAMVDDLCAAIRLVRERDPQRRIILAGLCSGGWLAFQAATRGLVDAVISVNPPMFLRDGAGGRQWVADKQELDRYQQSMRAPLKWIKALRGEASYATLARVAANTAGRYLARLGRALSDSPPESLAGDLKRIANRGVRTLFVFSAGDLGLEYFQLHAQAALADPRVRSIVRRVIVQGAGHTFRPLAAQRRLRDLLVEFVANEPRVAHRLHMRDAPANSQRYPART